MLNLCWMYLRKKEEMNDLLITSYKAQCHWVSNRIHNKTKKYYFDWTSEYILSKFQYFDTPKKLEKYLTWEKMFDGQEMAIQMFNETYYNLEKRFEDGYSNACPIERIA